MLDLEPRGVYEIEVPHTSVNAAVRAYWNRVEEQTGAIIYLCPRGGKQRHPRATFVSLSEWHGDDVVPATAEEPAIPETDEVEWPVDVNEASREELAAIPGFGPELADAIIAARPINGAADLLDVSGIGEGRLDSARDYLIL